MKFKALSLALLTAFALNIKAAETKEATNPTAPVAQSTPAQTQGVKTGATSSATPLDHTLDLPAKDDLGAGAANIPGLTDAQKSAELANTIDTAKAEAAAKKAKEAADYAKSLIGRTVTYVKGIPAKVSKAANDFATAANTYANNVAVNGVSMVKTHKIETAVVFAAVTSYFAALNGVFGEKIEKFTNKYKQFVAGAATVASAVLLYNLATTTPVVIAPVVTATVTK